MTIKHFLIGAAALAVLCLPAHAQSQSGSSTPSTPSTTTTPATTPATTSTKPPTIQQRKDNQQDRIAQGIQSGQLTAGETKNLETKEAGVNKEESTMRSEDDGHLTSADRSKLNSQQNKLESNLSGQAQRHASSLRQQ